MHCGESVLTALRDDSVPKGDAFAVARIAGLAGAKRCADLLPLAHVIGVHGAQIDLDLAEGGVRITASVRTAGRTGVEMEALTAVQVALLALVDMVKALDKHTWIGEIRLEAKTGGKSGDWRRGRVGE